MELRIRPAGVEDAGGIARVHVDTWRASYVGIVPEEHLANLSYDRSQAKWLEHLSHPQGEQAYVAENQAGQIVGFASGGPARDALPEVGGELYTLYILKDYQGMGIGKRLVRQVAESLVKAGYRTMLIWVLKDNPARGFYERLGGQLAHEKVVEIGGKPLVDAGYVWNDLRSFLKQDV